MRGHTALFPPGVLDAPYLAPSSVLETPQPTKSMSSPEVLGAADGIMLVGITTINDDVALLQVSGGSTPKDTGVVGIQRECCRT